MPTPALFTAAGAITSQQNAISVVSNNIANVNTTAYKSESVTFQQQTGTVLQSSTGPSLTIGGRNPMEVGSGNVLSSVSTNFAQGPVRSTGVVSDLAIQGSGFFAISPDAQADGSYSSIEYTRDGHFTVDSQGDLVTQLGYKVMGMNLYDSETGKNNYVSGYSAITFFSDQAVGPVDDPTVTATDGNLTAGNLAVPTPALYNTDGSDPSFNHLKVSEISVRGDLIDSTSVDTGSPGDLEITRNAEGKMVFTYKQGGLNGENFTAKASTNVTNADNVLTFDLVSTSSPNDKIQLRIRLKVGVTSLDEAFSNVAYSDDGTTDKITFGGSDPTTQATTDITVGVKDIEFLSTTNVRSLMGPVRIPSFFNVADTDIEAEATEYTINGDGTVVMRSAAGGEQAVSRLIMANFTNPDGLNTKGHNAYTQSANSGQAAISVLGGPFNSAAPSIAGTTMVSGALESSNVNLADQFAQLIAFQRGLQANAKSFSAANEILQTLINL